MMGYYVGVGAYEKLHYAIFLSGFLAGVLILAIGLFVNSFLNFIAFAGLVGALGVGLYFGATRPPFGKKPIDSLVKIFINGFAWTFQFFGIIISINLGGYEWAIFAALTAIAIIMAVIWKVRSSPNIG
jgi:hypothetical protein